MAPSQKVTKKWEIFAGRNKFYCDGYLMTAPNSGVFYFTVILITATCGLFFVFDCPFLAQRITPAIPIIGGILFVFTLSALFRTAFSDPGIIPRASQDEAAYIEKQIEVPNSLNSPTYRPPPRTKEVFVKGQTVKLKYCFTCKIFRPPRASHCSLCDNCVDRFDHHCPWVGNCVGKRNYRFFYMFIVSLAFLAVFIFSCTTTHIVMLLKEDNQFIDVVKRTPSSVIIAVICFCSVWSVIGLAGFHTYLTTSDQTTNEDIKGSFSSKGGQQAINPYSQGNICLNCFHILCGPITPSLIDRRGVVTDEYRTQMQSSTDKYNSATVPPLVVMQPGMDTLNKHYSLDHELQNASNGGTGSGGVYRQRSYDNLQNGKSPSTSATSVSVTHLNNLSLNSASQATTKTNSNHPLNHLQISSQSPSQYSNLSLSYVNVSPKQPQLYHSATCNLLTLSNNTHASSDDNDAFIRTTNYAPPLPPRHLQQQQQQHHYPQHFHQQPQQQLQQRQQPLQYLLATSANATNATNLSIANGMAGGHDDGVLVATLSDHVYSPPQSLQSHRTTGGPVPIPSNFKYFAPQSKYGGGTSVSGSTTYCYNSDQSQQLLLGGSSLGGGGGGSGLSPSQISGPLSMANRGATMPLLKSQSDFLHRSSPQTTLNGATPGSVMGLQQQQQQQQQQHQPLHMNLNMTLPRYPYHRNRAIGVRKSSHDLQFPMQHHQLHPHDSNGRASPGFYGTTGGAAASSLAYCDSATHLAPPVAGDSSNTSLNNHLHLHGIPIPYNSGLMLKKGASSSASSSSTASSLSASSTATISSNSTSASSSLERRCGANGGSGSGSYLASYDTITLSDQHTLGGSSVPQTCPSSPRTMRCSSPSCNSAELDPMLHATGCAQHGGGGKQLSGSFHRHRHHHHQHTGGSHHHGGKVYGGKLYKKPAGYQVKSSQSTPPSMPLPSPLATNPVSPALSFSQFSQTFWSANTCVSSSNRSSLLSTTSTLGGGGGGGAGTSTPYADCTNAMLPGGAGGSTGAVGPIGASASSSSSPMVVDGHGGAMSGYHNYGGTGMTIPAGTGAITGTPIGGNSNSSPYVQRRGGSDKRFSNVFEYQFNNFDLNSIHEDATNET
ncbi:hornerin-like isoform X1 [Anopheles albimanus]|uniref:protein S-acyltransferase n=1 Tax=Anopheles albimanus TaxID=7167 RepID=A0A182FCF7_ANOAL|nr:hornerin-like isoform X1 [Anopheles albimanus]XP_035791258.1 hornerin-like isoform X1 [Anopheles albimanus]XP_035791259.1 hornerin-like isoform X1 [Anopheles albimanus]XP_035791260.1 hornerin-like isoform X1 [Anopheles albimanus]